MLKATYPTIPRKTMVHTKTRAEKAPTTHLFINPTLSPKRVYWLISRFKNILFTGIPLAFNACIMGAISVKATTKAAVWKLCIRGRQAPVMTHCYPLPFRFWQRDKPALKEVSGVPVVDLVVACKLPVHRPKILKFVHQH